MCTAQARKGFRLLMLGKKFLVQLVDIFTDHVFEFSKHNVCKHFFTLFCGPLGNHAMAHWLENTDLKQKV